MTMLHYNNVNSQQLIRWMRTAVCAMTLTITSAKDVTFYLTIVCLSVCLSVC